MSKALRFIAGIVLIVVGIYTENPGLVMQGVGLIVGTALEKTPAKLRRLLEQTVMVRSAIAPQEIVYGRTRKSGLVTWYDANSAGVTSPVKNQFLWFVITVCEHEIDGYETLWIDNEKIDLGTEIDGWDGNGAGGGFVNNALFIDSDGNKLVKCGFYLGTDSQTADADLVASSPYWTSSHKGEGVAYFWVRLQIDSSKGGTDINSPPGVNVWSKGWPRELSVVLRGAKLYDPRKDATYLYTSPTAQQLIDYPHRTDDKTTWEWSNNSVLVRADYIKHDRFGPGYTAADIDWSVVAAQADIADQNVTIPGATTQKRWTIDGVVTVDDSPRDIIENLQTADHGATLFLPGLVKIYTGEWATPSHTITKDWITGAFSSTSSVPADNAFNAVRGKFLSEDQDYTLIGFQPVTSAAYETEDGIGRQWADIALMYTSNEFRAQRIALIELKKSRLQTSMTMECGPIAEQVDVYQTVTVDLPGYSSESDPSGVKTFRVTSKTTKTDGTVTLTLKEEQESDWDYTVTDLTTPPVVPSVTRGAEQPDAPTNLAAATVANGILLTWKLPQQTSGFAAVELYAATSNDRSLATLVMEGITESYLHRLTQDTEMYYWVVSRGIYNLLSDWEPASATGGVYGIAGSAGVDGQDAVLYYIKPTQGTAIINGGTGVQIQGTTLSAFSADNSFNDSGGGFIAAGFQVGDEVKIEGFTGNTANNIDIATITSLTATKMIIGGTEGDAIVSELAGDLVKISAWGELVVEAHLVTGGVDIALSSGNVKLWVTDNAGTHEVNVANGYGTGSNGYVGYLDRTHIDGAITIELRDGMAGAILDTVTLVDVADGGGAVYGYIESTNGLAWVRETDQTTWTPTSTNTFVECTFVKNGFPVARVARRVNRDSNGLLSDGNWVSHSDGSLNISRVSFLMLDEDTKAATCRFTYSYLEDLTVVSETLICTLSGMGGIAAGLSNPTPVVAVDSEGLYYAQTGTAIDTTDGIFEVFEGTTDITGLVTSMYAQDTGDGWSVSGSYYDKSSGGATLRIHKDTGDYWLYASTGESWTGVSFSSNVRVLVDGEYHTRKFTCQKAFGALSLAAKLKGIETSFSHTYGATSAGIRYEVNSDGNVYSKTYNAGSLNSTTNEGAWKSEGASTAYDVRFTLLSRSGKATGTTGFTGTFDTWQDLVSTHSLTLTDDIGSTSVHEIAQVFVEIRRNSSGEILATATITLDAFYNVA